LSPTGPDIAKPSGLLRSKLLAGTRTHTFAESLQRVCFPILP
jgi:hypothetical protein